VAAAVAGVVVTDDLAADDEQASLEGTGLVSGLPSAKRGQVQRPPQRHSEAQEDISGEGGSCTGRHEAQPTKYIPTHAASFCGFALSLLVARMAAVVASVRTYLVKTVSCPHHVCARLVLGTGEELVQL
jgi:hypothetical protein